MALLKDEAAKLTNNDLVAGVIEEVITRDELFARLPFTRVDGKAYVYNREAAGTFAMTDAHTPGADNIEADFLDPNDNVNEKAAKFVEITTNLRALIGDVDVDKFLQSVYTNTNNQRATQIAQKAKAMGNKFRRTLIVGDNTNYAKEFDGIGKLIVSGQTITAGANGAAITFSMLDELLDAVPNGADAIIMRPGTLRAYRAALRALGGAVEQSTMMGNFGMPIPMHNGVPILLNEFLPVNETQGSSSVCTSIYAARFNEADGLHGLFGGEAAGIVVEDLGTVQNRDATRTRLKWYCGLALKSTKSLARIKGITNI
ncbi:MAG: major capsid protein [Methylobacter sp.]